MIDLSGFTTKFRCFCRRLFKILHFLIVFIVENPFLLQLLYSVSSSIIGYFFLKVLDHRNDESFVPRNLDFFFTSVSAATVSSISTVEMEVFSNNQLIVFTVLMFIGGEVFTSMTGLHFSTFRLNKSLKSNAIHVSFNNSDSSSTLNVLVQKEFGKSLSKNELLNTSKPMDVELLKYSALNFFCYVVSSYFLIIQLLGVACTAIYLASDSSARKVLRNKELKLCTFSFFTVFSFFSSCGFVPTNETHGSVSQKLRATTYSHSPSPFREHAISFLVEISVMGIGKICEENGIQLSLEEYKGNRISSFSTKQAFVVFGLHSVWFRCSTIRTILFFGVVFEMNIYQKIVGIIFQTTNTRLAGGTIVDLATLSSAILALFIVMMYLPPYTTFLPMKKDEPFARALQCDDNEKKNGRFLKMKDNFIFSQLTHLAIFIILICITERNSIKKDPINFSFLNIVVEATSAYGGVGFSTLIPDNTCQDKWIGLSGRWSDEGKIVMIFLMFYGRVKKFNMDGGKAWKFI